MQARFTVRRLIHTTNRPESRLQLDETLRFAALRPTLVRSTNYGQKVRDTIGTIAFSKAARVMMSHGLMSRLISSSSALHMPGTVQGDNWVLLSRGSHVVSVEIRVTVRVGSGSGWRGRIRLKSCCVGSQAWCKLAGTVQLLGLQARAGFELRTRAAGPGLGLHF